MAKIEMIGEHEIKITFNNSHACKFYFDGISKDISLALRKTRKPTSRSKGNEK